MPSKEILFYLPLKKIGYMGFEFSKVGAKGGISWFFLMGIRWIFLPNTQFIKDIRFLSNTNFEIFEGPFL